MSDNIRLVALIEEEYLPNTIDYLREASAWDEVYQHASDIMTLIRLRDRLRQEVEEQTKPASALTGV